MIIFTKPIRKQGKRQKKNAVITCTENIWQELKFRVVYH